MQVYIVTFDSGVTDDDLVFIDREAAERPDNLNSCLERPKKK